MLGSGFCNTPTIIGYVFSPILQSYVDPELASGKFETEIVISSESDKSGQESPAQLDSSTVPSVAEISYFSVSKTVLFLRFWLICNYDKNRFLGRYRKSCRQHHRLPQTGGEGRLQKHCLNQ